MWQNQSNEQVTDVRGNGGAYAGVLAEEARYAAKFRNLTFGKETLYDNTCFIPISLGQDYHEGAKLESILSLVEKTFRDCVIIVSDCLHRHTLSIDDPALSSRQAFEQSIKAGEEWVERNSRYWADLSIPCSVVYWSDLLLSAGYAPNRHQVNTLCRNDVYANLLMDRMVSYFVDAACSPDAENAERLRVAGLSREYLLEEHAIQLSMIPTEYPHHHFVYPHTNRLDPLMDFSERLSGEPCRWLRVRISRK